MTDTGTSKYIAEQYWARHESTLRPLHLENHKSLQDVTNSLAEKHDCIAR